MRWLFVSAVLVVGLGTLPVSAGPFGRTFYSTNYCPTYYQPYYQPTYYATPAYTAPAYTAPAAPVYNAATWEAEAIKYAKQKDDYANFQKTMAALGINYATSNYAAEAAYPGVSPTLYGYSYQTVKEAYGALDVNQLFQTQARLAAGTKEAMAEANAAFASNVGVVTDAQARVQEILAKGKAVEASLIAANAQGSAKSTTTTTVIQPNVVANVSDPSMQAFLRDVAGPACASCHTGPKAKGNVDITQYASFTPQQKAVVLDRITTADMSKRMPRLADGKPGSLSPEGIKAFATH